MKKILTTALAAAALLGLAGCAASTEAKTGPGQVLAKTVELPDSRQVVCVFWVPVDASGVASAEGAQMDCDWVGVAR